MINWQLVDTVLLDMDGTLLDLHFDNHFWLKVVPEHISQQQQCPIEDVRQIIYDQYQQVQGTLNWYSIEYWQKQLNIDIMALKHQLSHKIGWLKDAKPFLEALGKMGKQRILITNAHPQSLELKKLHTGLDNHLDEIYSTHQFGFAKESPQLWQQLQKHCGYNPKRCLFIDDNAHLLRVSKQVGIAFQLGIFQPDSQHEGKSLSEFKTIKSYRSLTQSLLNSIN